MPDLRETSSVSLACRTVGFSKDGCEETFVAPLSVAHQNQILRGFQPLFSGLHKLLDECLVPSSTDKADQKAAFGINGCGFPKRFLLASRIPVTLVHLYRGGFDLFNPLVVKLP